MVYQGHKINDVCSSCAKRYFSVIKEVAAMGYEIIVFNILPSSYYSRNNPPLKYIYSKKCYPKYLSCEKRNKITHSLNSILKKKCKKRGYVFIDVFDNFVHINERKEMKTKQEYFPDGFHLKSLGWNKVINEMVKLNLIDYGEQ